MNKPNPTESKITNSHTLKPGDKIRIIFSTGQKLDREAVFVYLGTRPGNIADHDTLSFNARPLAGTQEIVRRSIRAMYLCDPSEKLLLPRIFRGAHGEPRLI